MFVYRITTQQWSTQLTGSGYAGRWNSNGRFVIYTAANRSLACLENLVHRNGAGLHSVFRTMVIEVPKKVSLLEIHPKDLPKNWNTLNALQFTATQQLGDSWLRSQESCVLQVPSAIIPEEYNYLINPQHSDFKYISIHSVENFIFDSRLKS